MAELGLMGIPIPEEYGGGGADTLSYAIAVEELTRIDSSVAITVAAHTSLGTMPIFLFGTEEQKQRVAARPRLGQEARRVRADRAGRGLGRRRDAHDAPSSATAQWVIDGSKIFITNAGTDITACVTITARTGEDEISNLIVPNGTPGYEISRADAEARLARLRHARALVPGLPPCPRGTCSAPRGEGFKQFLEILDGGRISVAAMGVGLAQGAYDLAYAYALERQQFGKPIATFQAVQFQLADMATEIEAGRALVYKAAWLKDQGRAVRAGGGDGEALHRRALATGRRTRAPDPRRLRLHGRVRDLAALPRPEDPRDRRGHERGAAHGDRAAPRPLPAS